MKIKDFESSLIVLEPTCKIWKSLKNGNLVLQLPKFIRLRLVFFPRIRELKLLFTKNFWFFIKYHKFFFTIWCNIALYIILNLVNQNLLRIEWQNGICKLSQEKNKVGAHQSHQNLLNIDEITTMPAEGLWTIWRSFLYVVFYEIWNAEF